MPKASVAKTVKQTPTKKAVVKKNAAAPKAASKKTAPKKTVAGKASSSEKEKKTIHLKYNDKSAGQPELVEIFTAIKKMMEPYDKKRALVLHADKPSQSILVSHKSVVIDGRPHKELWFVAALVQKGYVGFYYMPIYAQDDLRTLFSEEFVKTLKGKACFHIKKNTPQLMADIKKAIKVGYDAYVERGWL